MQKDIHERYADFCQGIGPKYLYTTADDILELYGFKISHHHFRTPYARLKVAITQLHMAIEMAESEDIIPRNELEDLYQIEMDLLDHLGHQIPDSELH